MWVSDLDQQYWGKPKFAQNKNYKFTWGKLNYFHGRVENIKSFSELKDKKYDMVYMGQTIEHIYPEKLLNTDELRTWFKEKSNEINLDSSKQVRRLSYWKCTDYCLTEIYKDQEWWDNNVHKFHEFWEKVIYYRKNGFDDLLPKKRISVKQVKNVECLIQSDDEDNKPNNKLNNKSNNSSENKSDICIIVSDED